LFPSHRGDSGKCNKITARHHRKYVPGSIPTMEEMLGDGVSPVEGTTLKRKVLKML
jgi:hypothetical protein